MNANAGPLTALAAAVALALAPAFTTSALAQGADGAAIFDARCKTCHEPPIDRAPSRAELAGRPKIDVVRTLTTGVMASMAQGLTAAEIDAVANYLNAPTDPGRHAGAT